VTRSGGQGRPAGGAESPKGEVCVRHAAARGRRAQRSSEDLAARGGGWGVKGARGAAD
jgi:hypothetical protein